MFRFCFLLLICFSTNAQTIKILESGKRVSIRGLSVVTDNIIWASGTGGNVARSTNGGESFNWIKVPGYEKMDFRDIEAFDSNTAIIMGITAPAVVLKTKDGGKTWKKVFEDTAKGAFIDAMDFADENYGIIIGDPVKNLNMYSVTTYNQGETWQLHDGPVGGSTTYWTVQEGEAFFASSGTNIKIWDHHGSILATGGKVSRLHYDLKWYPLPIMQGKESTGANSVAVYKNQNAVVVGGDYSKDTISLNNCVLIDLGNKLKFSAPQTNPHGYRSCVIYMDKKTLLTCGTSGIDISRDGGKNWELVAKDGFHVCQKAKKGNAVFLAGNGKIAKLVMP